MAIHYIKINENNCIIDGFSTGIYPNRDITGYISINDDGSYQFRLFDNGTENPTLTDELGVYLYQYTNNVVSERSTDDINADRLVVETNNKAYMIRNERNRIMNDVDVIYCNASNWVLIENQLEWQEYKQALRDISEQDGFPNTVVWPTRPELKLAKLQVES